jgi:hypothetical protein
LGRKESAVQDMCGDLIGTRFCRTLSMSFRTFSYISTQWEGTGCLLWDGGCWRGGGWVGTEQNF